MTWEDYLEEIANGTISPGINGTLLGVCGIFVALTKSVAKLSTQSPDTPALQEEMERTLNRADSLLLKIKDLQPQEVEAYNQLTSAIALPQHTQQEKDNRKECLNISLKGYTRIPFKLLKITVETLRLTETLYRYGNSNLKDEAKAALTLAVAAYHIAESKIFKLLQLQDSDWSIEKQVELTKIKEEFETTQTTIASLD
jgi:methenyltetrahydrofolate cyclohydrolase